jgi:hypothetical protein
MTSNRWQHKFFKGKYTLILLLSPMLIDAPPYNDLSAGWRFVLSLIYRYGADSEQRLLHVDDRCTGR